MLSEIRSNVSSLDQGEKVAYWGKGSSRFCRYQWRFATFERSTATQGVLSDGTRFRLEDGTIVGDRWQRVYKQSDVQHLIDEQNAEIQARQELEDLRNQICRSLNSLIHKSHQFTAEQCRSLLDQLNTINEGND